MVVRCQRCNRVLKTPESVEAGYGRVCYKKVSALLASKINKFEDDLSSFRLDFDWLAAQEQNKTAAPTIQSEATV